MAATAAGFCLASAGHSGGSEGHCGRIESGRHSNCARREMVVTAGNADVGAARSLSQREKRRARVPCCPFRAIWSWTSSPRRIHRRMLGLWRRGRQSWPSTAPLRRSLVHGSVTDLAPNVQLIDHASAGSFLLCQGDQPHMPICGAAGSVFCSKNGPLPVRNPHNACVVRCTNDSVECPISSNALTPIQEN
jgi:hypothetical protein